MTTAIVDSFGVYSPEKTFIQTKNQTLN